MGRITSENAAFFYPAFRSGQRIRTIISLHRYKKYGTYRRYPIRPVKQIAAQAKNIGKVELFLNRTPAVVCGSTWPPDEEILIDYINQYQGTYKWILTPHEIGENHIKSIMEKCQKSIVRYTDESADYSSAKVLIIDCIGLLSAIYRYGKIAYIGGGFGVGIHNTLEAAVYGIPVIFGPKYRKFKEAVSLIQEGGAFTIQNGNELNAILDSLWKIRK